MKKLLSVALICMAAVPESIIGKNYRISSMQDSLHKTDINRPNVIVILSDDQGYGDFSCHGNPVLKTPAIDRLYNESIRFSNFHVAPLCTPTRGQLMTGLDALHNKAATVLTARNLMRRDIITMPEVFKRNGYRTGIFGKWHLGDTYPDRPMDRGFEKCIWHKGWGLLSEIEYDNDYYKTRFLDSLKTCYSDEYCTDLWFKKSMEWMEQVAEKKQPFFTYLALNAPHGPFYSPKEDYELYRSQVSDSTTASFLGMINNIDHNMELLDQWLIRRKMKENTIVVFMNDNGGTGGVKLYNAGMRGEKGSLYEGGHRAACFLRLVKTETGGRRETGEWKPQTLSYPSQIQDLLPTFIDLLVLKRKPNLTASAWFRSLNPKLFPTKECSLSSMEGMSIRKNILPVSFGIPGD